jgi:uncharacterized protein YkwD
MSPSNHVFLRSLIFGVAFVFAFTGGASASAADSVAVADCPSVDVAPTVENAVEIRASVLCLTNAERSTRGLASLRENVKLRSAALAHSSDMVRDGYFAHTTPGGDTFVERILGARYASRKAGWALGENLAWGTGDQGTPRGVHEAWMRSSGHRANMLNGRYRELGIGVRPGVPKNAGVGATYTIDFGVRS